MCGHCSEKPKESHASSRNYVCTCVVASYVTVHEDTAGHHEHAGMASPMRSSPRPPVGGQGQAGRNRGSSTRGRHPRTRLVTGDDDVDNVTLLELAVRMRRSRQRHSIRSHRAHWDADKRGVDPESPAAADARRVCVLDRKIPYMFTAWRARHGRR